MTITKEEALQKAFDYLSLSMKHRVKIVDRISGCFYMTDKIDVDNSWIIYIQPNDLILDGPGQYIIINKQTGIITEVTTN